MKFFTKEVKIALTAIVAVGLCYYIINFLKGINIFTSSNTYYVTFTDIQGLTVSNNVFSNGYSVGLVRRIDYDYKTKNKVVAEIELNKNMRIPKGSRAELQTSLMGGVTMNLILGPNPTDVIAQGDTITGGPHFGAVAQAQKALPDLVALIPKLDSILSGLNRVAQNPALMEMAENLAGATAHIKTSAERFDQMMANDIPEITANLRTTSQQLAALSKEVSGGKVDRLLVSADSSMHQLQATTHHLNDMTQHLNRQISATDNTVGLLLNNRTFYDRVVKTVENTDSLVRDLRLHPKRYVHFSIFGRKSK